MTLSAFRELVKNNHRIPADAEVLTQGSGSQEDQAIADAVKRYSSRMPLSVATSLSTTGEIDLSSLDSWGTNSRVTGIHDSHGCRLVAYSRRGTVLKLPRSGSFTVTYSVTHTLDDFGSTIPEIDVDAVAHLAAALVLNQIANLYAQKKNSSIDSDAVDYGRLSGEYFMRSRDEQSLYDSHISTRVPKRSATVSWGRRR